VISNRTFEIFPDNRAERDVREKKNPKHLFEMDFSVAKFFYLNAGCAFTSRSAGSISAFEKLTLVLQLLLNIAC